MACDAGHLISRMAVSHPYSILLLRYYSKSLDGDEVTLPVVHMPFCCMCCAGKALVPLDLFKDEVLGPFLMSTSAASQKCKVSAKFWHLCLTPSYGSWCRMTMGLALGALGAWLKFGTLCMVPTLLPYLLLKVK